jgi:hypothetical protein
MFAPQREVKQVGVLFQKKAQKIRTIFSSFQHHGPLDRGDGDAGTGNKQEELCSERVPNYFVNPVFRTLFPAFHFV